MNRGALTILVVDDEPQARFLLLAMLEGREGIARVLDAPDVGRAMSLILQERPEVILLDIEMPGENGFDLVRRMRAQGLKAQIIFTTAYQHYAVQAIRHAAFDYLLKPVVEAELQASLNRLRSSMEHDGGDRMDKLLQLMDAHSRIKINIRTGFLLIDSHDLVYAEAEGNYTLLHLTGGNTEMASMNLGKVQELLPPRRFTRISRSTFINLDYLVQVHRRKRLCLLQFDGQKTWLSVSIRHLQPLEEHCEAITGPMDTSVYP
ncbi:MAG TPA: LytTR family DNA-binding domain-containing protein [Bacteroidales bacterium]|nr:LytTR family DNA-binding domain-containing protein [Bacteroidales bacterium]HRZ78231.1 LytTR family DNA-binding domain-containing protein [Bacteroidales bacterium]